MSRHSTAVRVWDEKRLRFATDAAGLALWSWNVDTDEIALDERSLALWGLPASGELVTFEVLSERIHPEDLDRVRAAFNATREVPGPYELDFRIMHGPAIRWVSARGLGDDQGIIGRVMFGVFLDTTERKAAEEAREMLAAEMSHRVKNLFAIAAALTRIAERSAATSREMAADLTRRLLALGEAHELIRPSLVNPKRAADLGALLSVLLAAYDDKGRIGDRIRVAGPDILVGEASITIVALVVHELATNSVKYGALSEPAGTLDVAYADQGAEVLLVWTEHGGPLLTVPQGQLGFGSKLVNRSITGQLGGSIEFDWLPEGVVVTLRVSKARLGV